MVKPVVYEGGCSRTASASSPDPGGPCRPQGYAQEGLHLWDKSTISNPCVHCIHTANEGPVRIEYKCLVPIHAFPEMKLFFPKQNYNVLSPSSYTHVSVRDLYIFPGSVCLFCCREICGLILGIYKSLTDT